MKRLIILLAITGLFMGCARNRQTSQGGAGYNESTGSSMGTSTNSISPNQGGTGTGTQQGGTTDQGTPKPAPGGAP